MQEPFRYRKTRHSHNPAHIFFGQSENTGTVPAVFSEHHGCPNKSNLPVYSPVSIYSVAVSGIQIRPGQIGRPLAGELPSPEKNG